uniref:ATP synthase complex subunit 8 n=1 Tax=Tuxedo bicinctus TaxID=2127002 RepID=A0A514LQ31_9HEMI|nr:ATP synthase F0 subunit 8 [Tuxedo bicinctus]QDI93949.1 ATP synthase F0 subunit 8 [Tuxedo bicinctus]
MPQMSPMWWSTLFLLFLATYMLIMTSMYTYKIYQNENSLKKTKSAKYINWKW